jgi:hypothetical protein
MSFDSLLQRAKNAESPQLRDRLINQAARVAKRELDAAMRTNRGPVAELRVNAMYLYRRLRLAELQPSLLASDRRPSVRYLWFLLHRYKEQDVKFNKPPPPEPMLDFLGSTERQIAAAEQVMDWCKGLAVKRRVTQTNRRPRQTPMIWYHTNRSYSRDGRNPVRVSAEMHNALQAFLDRDVALDTPALETAGVLNVSRVMSKIAAKFGTHIVKRPRRRGDGYRVRVRTRRSEVATR